MTPNEPNNTDTTADESALDPASSSVQDQRRALLQGMRSATVGGMFPLIAYGLDKETKTSQAILITSSIPDMVLAWDLLERFLSEDYEFTGYVPWSRLEAFADSHRTVVRKHILSLDGFNSANPEHAALFNHQAQMNSASKWHQKAYGLVDICDFSLATIEEQLAYRTSLALALNQASSRVSRLVDRKYLPPALFHSTSTGDGFYFWHRFPGGGNDVAVFMLLLYVMVQSEAMRSARIPMRLRGAFGIGNAYTFPSRELGDTWGREPKQNSIGPILNQLARLLMAATPGQILVGNFDRPGREQNKRLNPKALIEQAERELLPTELSPHDPVKPQSISLEFSPQELLRVTDKHGALHYCYNLVGSLPNRSGMEDIRIQKVGIAPDPSVPISSLRFTA